VSGRYEQLEISSREQGRAWLAEHHADSPGVWVVTHKRTGTRDPRVDRDG